MLLRLLIAVAAIAMLSSAVSCPADFDLMGGGRCIKEIGLQVQAQLSVLMDQKVAECETLKGHLPIVKNAQDNTDYINIVKAFDELKDIDVMLVLGMLCNTTTKSGHLVWEDKSAITYIQPPRTGQDPVNLSFDCVARKDRVVSRITPKDWYVVPDSISATTYTYTFLCETDPINGNDDPHCGEYEEMTISTDFNKPCIKVYTDKLSSMDARIKCDTNDFGSLATIHNDQENLYIRRTANTAGVIAGGMHIGAYLQEDATADAWLWLDGEVPIKGVYNNFQAFPPPVPAPPHDEICSYMVYDTALWLPEDCETELLPFVCRRSRFPPPTLVCARTPPPEGVLFFPPNFPTSNVTCEYTLSVVVGKIVELEVMNLEANKGADYLLVYDGPGDTPIAKTPPPPDNIIRTLTNVMRVLWQPNGAVNVRGFRLQYTAQDP